MLKANSIHSVWSNSEPQTWGFGYVVCKTDTFIISCVARVLIAWLHGQNRDFGACLLNKLL